MRIRAVKVWYSLTSEEYEEAKRIFTDGDTHACNLDFEALPGVVNSYDLTTCIYNCIENTESEENKNAE